ncbi:MAG TPA: zinc ribbon domain-containing protein, partial [Candidatus Scatomorpha merdavium]|nr:zinc ribbon domain-containing protein [Candidatus Scatomorpha merdavium]
MSFCTKCGAQLPKDAAFCTKCGAPAQRPGRRRPGGAEIWAAACGEVKSRWRRKIGSRNALIAAAAGLVVVVLVVVLTVLLGGREGRGKEPGPDWQGSVQTAAPQEQGGGTKPGAAPTQQPQQPDSGGEALSEAELRQRGTFMRVSRLTDSGLNMVVGQMTAPDDWQVSEQVQWSSYGNYPGMTQLSAVSPDGLRSFQLISTMSYFQTDSIFSSLGENETDPTTYRIHRQYRTAEQFVELFISNLGCTSAQKLGSSSIDSQSLGALQSVAEQHAYQTGYSLVQSLANLGMSANLVGYESTVVDNRYAVTTQSGQTEYIEVFTLVWAYQTSWVVQNSSITVNEIYWCVPFMYISTAESEQALASTQNEFLTFVSNSHVSPEFYYLVQQYRSYIENQLAQQLTNQIQAATEIQSQLMDGYSSSSDTNDRVTDMWSDYIYDRDDYTTSDGSTVKVPTYYDHVYETDSGDIYVTND